MSFDENMEEIARLFIDESVEGLDIMESGLLDLKPGAADSETMNSIFRAAHSIKGGGATFGFTQVSEFAHHVETLLDEMRQGKRDVDMDEVDLLLESVDILKEMIDATETGHIDTTRSDAMTVKLEHAIANPGAGATPSSATATVDVEKIIGWNIQFNPKPSLFSKGSDPSLLFTELQELGELEVTPQNIDQLDFDHMNPEECALAWSLTLHGEVEEEQIKNVFAWVEEECELQLESIVEKVAAEVVEQAKEPVKESKPAPAAAPKAAKSSSTENASIRVNIDKVDALINLVGELVITQSMLSRFHDDFDFTQLIQLREGLTQLSRNSRELQESVMAIRMLPIGNAFSRFPRLVRDTSKTLGKKVDLQVTGENTELDKTVMEKIGDPLVHLVRNSLDHGLETPEKRKALGKSETGILGLNAYHESGNIIIEVIDDGAGINKERVLAKAIEKGLVSADEKLSDDKINNLIFLPGFSTADVISDLSGRGVGMDVVRRNIADLGGHVSVESHEGVGSTFTISLPLTLAILDGQLVRVGDQSFIVSLLAIVETIQASSEYMSVIAGGSELYRLRDEYLPIIRLNEIFGMKADSDRIEDGLLVVVEASGQRVAIFVDDLQDQQQVVIKSLEDNYQKSEGISGATILGDGKVALIVDVPGLIQLFYDKQNGSQLSA